MGGRLNPPGRLFAAVVPTPEVEMALAESLAGLAVPGRVVPPFNWHVTLRFAGPLDEVTYERWLAALDQIEAGALRIRLGGWGAFPRAPKATVLWIGVDAPGLDDLAASVEEATQAAGLPSEERPFRPHLTVARLRPPVDVSALVRHGELPRLEWRAAEFHVMSAVGGRYVVHETFPLATG